MRRNMQASGSVRGPAAVLPITAIVAFSFATNPVNSEVRMNASDLIAGIRNSHELDTVDNISILIVPKGVLFRTSVDPATLQNVSCIYRAPKSLAHETLSLLEHSIKNSKTPANTHLDLRLGVVFRDAENNVLREFFFQDWGGKHDVEGISREYWILASADTPNRFRDFVIKNRVDLIAKPYSKCP